MPPNDTLTFNCPACGIRLTIPVSLAGVEGPCPSCRTAIRAPQIQAYAFAPHPEPEPVLARPPFPADSGGPGPRIRPEPRELPERSVDVRSSPLMPRKTTDDEELRRHPTQNSRRVRRPKPLFRLVVPLIVLAAAAAVVGFLVRSNKKNASQHPLDRTYPVLTTPLGSPLPPEPAPEKKATSAVGTPVAPSGSPLVPILPSPDDIGASRPGSETAAVASPLTPPLSGGQQPVEQAKMILEEFLTAKDATSRLALIEPEMTVEQLSKTPLAGPLPPVELITHDGVRENKAENASTYYFNVTLTRDGKATDYTMAVRRRGNNLPRVFAPPVIEQLGDQLAKFAATPTKEVKPFYICFKSSFSAFDDVPEGDKKFVLRFSNAPYGTEIARAYGSNQETSRFSRLFGSPESEAHWGNRVLGQVTLQWSDPDKSKNRYLEVLDIKALHWDP